MTKQNTLTGFAEEMERWQNRRESERRTAMLGWWNAAIAKVTSMTEDEHKVWLMNRYQKRESISSLDLAADLAGANPMENF